MSKEDVLLLYKAGKISASQFLELEMARKEIDEKVDDVSDGVCDDDDDAGDLCIFLFVFSCLLRWCWAESRNFTQICTKAFSISMFRILALFGRNCLRLNYMATLTQPLSAHGLC